MHNSCTILFRDPTFAPVTIGLGYMVRIKIRLGLGLALGLGLRLTLPFITGAIVAGANVVRSS